MGVFFVAHIDGVTVKLTDPTQQALLRELHVTIANNPNIPPEAQRWFALGLSAQALASQNATGRTPADDLSTSYGSFTS